MMDCIRNLKAEHLKLTDMVLEKAKTFKSRDYIIMKTTLVALGVLIGATFSKPLGKYKPLLALLFLFGYQYLILRIFFIKSKEEECDK